MKALILTSSIFYLLGLKLTNEVELNQKSLNDSLKITPQPELVLPKQDIKELPKMETECEDAPIKCGSDEDTAPWVPQKENSEVE